MHSISHQSTVCTVMHSLVHSLYYVYLYLITCFVIPFMWLATGVNTSLFLQSLQFRMRSETIITKYSNQNLASSCTMIEPLIWDVRYRKFSKHLTKDYKTAWHDTWVHSYSSRLASFTALLDFVLLYLTWLSLLHYFTPIQIFYLSKGQRAPLILPSAKRGKGICFLQIR
jgi:hypothetical protein